MYMHEMPIYGGVAVMKTALRSTYGDKVLGIGLAVLDQSRHEVNTTAGLDHATTLEIVVVQAQADCGVWVRDQMGCSHSQGKTPGEAGQARRLYRREQTTYIRTSLDSNICD